MKKIITFIIIMIIPILSFSQNKIGILGGINKTLLYTDFLSNEPLSRTPSEGENLGIHLGVVYEFKLNDNISFRPKLILSQQGYVKNYSSNNDVKPTYLNLPLNFKFFKKTYLIVGPQIGYILNKKRIEEVFPTNDKFDFGANIGVGREFKDIFIEFNLYQGFKNPFDVQFLENSENTVFQLSLGYNFK